MEIAITKEQELIKVKITGRVDSNTSPQLQSQLEEYYKTEGFDLLLDFAELEFISSAGLRVLLMMQKMTKSMQGHLALCNVSPEVMEVFEMTGFVDLLEIQ